MSREFAVGDCILRCVVGSTVHGLSIDGQDDIDEMGVCIEPPEYVIGLRHFEQYINRTKPEGVRSRAGDKDSIVYSLRKWARLAVGGNPTILLLLFVPSEYVIETNLIGKKLQALHKHIIAKTVCSPFLGYMRAQRQRLLGERGQKRVKRPELEEAYGFDTKYAMHMLRLGFQGIEIMREGKLTLPMREPERGILRGVREGKYTFNDVTTMAGELEQDIITARENSPLPESPNIEAVNDFLINAYRQYWPRPKGL